MLRSRYTLPLILPAVAIVIPALALHTAQPARARTADAASCGVDSSRLALDDQEQAALDDVNGYRAGHGAPPLTPSLTLTRAALWKSASMAAGAPFGHDDPARSWSQRMTDCGYDDSMAGENLAAGETTANAAVTDWENSPHHNENLLDPAFTAVGIKRVFSSNPGDRYGWYWTMDFGGSMDMPLGGQ